MAKRRKNRRMFPREERKRYSAAVAAVPQSERDRTELAAALGAQASDVTLVEAWLSLRELADEREVDETRFMGVLEREFQRRTGVRLTLKSAEDRIAAEEDQRDIERAESGEYD
jgi:hypothetical protein